MQSTTRDIFQDRDLLTQILVRVPYEQCSHLYTINKDIYNLFQDRSFWMDKAIYDLNISHKIFSKTDALDAPRQRYLDLREEIRTRESMIKFLREVFNLGMYILGWKGIGHVYPTASVLSPINFISATCAIAQIFEIYNSSDSVKFVIDKLKLINRTIPHRNLLIDLLKGMGESTICCRPNASRLISTANYYLTTMYNQCSADYDSNLRVA